MTEQQQNKSISDLEADIARSRERLAATVDELAFRAQPKNIVAEQKRQIRNTVMDKYHSLMGTSSDRTSRPSTVYRADGTTYSEGGSAVDRAKAKAEELKTQAALKADELKAQATAKVDELKTRQSSDDTTGERSGFADLKTRAQVQADQARLKLDEATHDADGELRADRIATGLAVAGASLVAMGLAKRNRG